MSKEFTAEEVKAHTNKDDLYLVIHGKGRQTSSRFSACGLTILVYDSSKFLDEHPGGEEVIIDVAGESFDGVL